VSDEKQPSPAFFQKISFEMSKSQTAPRRLYASLSKEENKKSVLFDSVFQKNTIPYAIFFKACIK
jgi:hypothetical protein